MLSNDDAGISHKMSGNLFWQYYDALYNALSCAIQQSRCENNVAMTDNVWELDDNWWVKDGSIIAAEIDEYPVYPTINSYRC
jgi:hypothetical protein